MKSTFGIGSMKGALPGREQGGPYAASPTRNRSLNAGSTMNTMNGTFTVGTASTFGGGGGFGASTLGGGSRSITINTATTATRGGPSFSMAPAQIVSGGLADDSIVNVENRFPEKPTLQQKQRLVFEEFDVKNKRCFTLEGFKCVLKALNIEFTADTIEDMYERADLNKNGRLTYPEYLNWADHYPNLVDAIYNRARSMVERARRDHLVEAQKGKLEQAQKLEREQQDFYDTSKRDLEIAMRDAGASQEEHYNRIDLEKQRQEELFEATRGMENAKVQRNSAEMEWQAYKGREREATQPLLQLRNAIGTCTDRMGNNDAVLEQLNDRVRQLEDNISELKKDITKLTDDNLATEEETERLKTDERDLMAAAEEAQQVTKNLHAEFKAAENEARKAIEAQAKALAAQTRALEDARKAGQIFESVEAKIAPFRIREQQQLSAHQASIKVVDDADGELRNREIDLANISATNQASDVDEHVLLEHEVRLREQRFNLDDRDDVLHVETTRLVNVLGRHDTRAIGTRRI